MAQIVKDITTYLEEWAPPYLAEDWDNSGLSVGNPNQEVKKILLALDVLDEVIDEAVDLGADMIVTHHPMLLFKKLNSITTETPVGNRIHKLIRNNISAYAAHTNLDSAKGGINDILADLAGLQDVSVLEVSHVSEDGTEEGLGRVGMLPEPMKFVDFAKRMKEQLHLPTIRLVGDGNQMVQKVGMCSGSGMSMLPNAIAENVDAFITGDARYHESQKALEAGICIVDGTHYASEVIVLPLLKKYLEDGIQKNGWNIEVVLSKVDGQTFWDL
ncbi:Nif3-like dinuclear metal center hexameric protein [Chakrabartyella piscis]|uniref:Nif3-like dinuclear metal center hexameric protein n=1 Tax=Chakrabartyella piscis TaxID=2918914 RepID=UPI00295881B0|nr:Nif3-like dinuclear metal center hexameric protein [Chakrabartyella piscis]